MNTFDHGSYLQSNTKELFDMTYFLSLPPHDFDQSTLGRRSIADQGLSSYIVSNRTNTDQIHQAINIMSHYINHYQFADNENYLRQLIQFHIAQQYALIGANEQALQILQSLQFEGYTNVGVEYLQFTISFLQGDLSSCSTIVNALPSDGDILSTDTIQRMIAFWGFSYIEAYFGMKWDNIKEYAKTHHPSH